MFEYGIAGTVVVNEGGNAAARPTRNSNYNIIRAVRSLLPGILLLGACSTAVTPSGNTVSTESPVSSQALERIGKACSEFRTIPYDEWVQKLRNRLALAGPPPSNPQPLFTPGPGKDLADYDSDRLVCSNIKPWTAQGFTDCMVARRESVQGAQASPMTQPQIDHYASMNPLGNKTTVFADCLGNLPIRLRQGRQDCS